MDDYPPACIAHDLPLLTVSGLTAAAARPLLPASEVSDSSILIRSEAPAIETREAKSTLHYIQSIDASHLPWSPGDGSRKHRFKVKTIGRVRGIPASFLHSNGC